MVDISTFSRNAAAMKAGEWIKAGPEYGDLEVKVAYLGHAYLDEVAAKMRVLGRRLGGVEKIGSEAAARINTEALIAHGLIDVRGLTEGGQPVTVARLGELLLDPANAELTNLVFSLCNQVGRARDGDLADAVGNSAAASPTA